MEKIDFINNQQPALNATNLNKIQDNTEDAIQEVQDVVDDLDTNKLDKASVKDTYSTSATDTYSCNYVNRLETYSTDETRVGTWIDGKPIYRKVIVETTVNTGSNVLSLDSSIDTMTNYTVYSYRNTSATAVTNQCIKDNSYTDANNHIIIVYRAYNKEIEVYIKGLSTINKIVAIIEYTKTTD